jgi:hypothetical protein
LKKDSSLEPPKYYVFFKAKDADVLTAAFKEFTAKTLNKSQKPTIKEKLRNFKENVIENVQERSREKKKTRGAEL